jgi:multidrug efflux pump subunit AcrB
MVLAFVGSWRSTLIVGFSIPMSVMLGVCGLKLTGQTFNLMTLGGLSLVVGMLVDDATVEIENINRNRNEGKPILRAILDGARQVALPALAATLSICIVFFPVVLLTGPSKYLFIPLALSVVFSMLASYLLSRTLVPTLSSMLLPHEKLEDERAEDEQRAEHRGLWARVDLQRRRALDKLRDGYGALLDRAMQRPGLTLGGALAFIALSGLLYSEVGLDFFPTVDAGLMRLHFHAPSGTRIEQTEVLVDAVEQTVRRIVPAEELDTIDDNLGIPISYNLGFVPTNNANDADAEITIALKPKHHDTARYEDQIRTALRDGFPGTLAYFEQADIVSQVLNFGAPSQVDVQVQARRYEQALPIALRLERALRAIPGAVDVRLGQEINHPALRVEVDRQRALQLGLTQQNVASSLLTSLASSALVSPNFWVDPSNGVNYTVVVQTPIYHVADLPSLVATPITGQGSLAAAAMTTSGYAAPVQLPPPPPPVTAIAPYLGSIATVRAATTRAAIRHETVQPTLDVQCGVEGRDLGSVAADIDDAIASLGKPPPGVQVALAGQPQTMRRAFGRLALGMVVAALLVYLLLVVLFQSWIDPFLIMLAVPASLSGVLWMLLFTRTTLNVESLMGAIMAIGIAASNSILLVHFANDRRIEDESVGPLDAAVHAGCTRMRPVLMTAFAMILGMMPMALGLGEGGQQNAPLARAVIGGLAVSTFATLVVIPCAYAVIRKKPPVIGKHDRAVLEAERGGELPEGGRA